MDVKKNVGTIFVDTDFTQEITCPWCGHEQHDSWEASDDGEYICDVCENEYYYTRDVEVTYSTAKKIMNVIAPGWNHDRS